MRTVYETALGPMLVNTADMFLGKCLIDFGEFSHGECELFETILRPGMTVIDVGANIGAHTVFFARAVGPTGKVYAFEPQRLLYQQLCANVALNQLDNVFAIQEALSDKGSVIMLKPLPQDPELGPLNYGGIPLEDMAVGGSEAVVVRPLSIPCNFLKIDVEGMELQVLKGAAAMIRACRPIIYCENDRDEKSEALIQYLHILGYRTYWHTPPLWRPNNFNRSPNTFGRDIVSINMLCLPMEHDLDPGLQEIVPKNP
jgi:FkbM family methyltransferase